MSKTEHSERTRYVINKCRQGQIGSSEGYFLVALPATLSLAWTDANDANENAVVLVNLVP